MKKTLNKIPNNSVNSFVHNFLKNLYTTGNTHTHTLIKDVFLFPRLHVCVKKQSTVSTEHNNNKVLYI